MHRDRFEDVGRWSRLGRPADPDAMLLAVGFFLAFLLAGLVVLALLGDAAVLVGAIVGAALLLPPVWLLSRERP